MKYTKPGNYNTWLNNSKKEVFILKHDLILKTYTEGKLDILTKFHFTISSGHLISDSSSVLTEMIYIFKNS